MKLVLILVINVRKMSLTFSLKYIVNSLVKLSLSVVCSTIISIERELHTHPGGVATHNLVGLGSCLFTMISVYLRDKYESPNADPARICAQVVSGMGFLGSATIFKSNNYVKGINTAANLWISAAISMAIGADLWELAIITSGFTAIILVINNRYKKYKYGQKKKEDKRRKLASKLINDKNGIVPSYIELSNLTKFVQTLVKTQLDDNESIENGELDRDPLDAPYGDEEYRLSPEINPEEPLELRIDIKEDPKEKNKFLRNDILPV